jgi:large subunit ribosomal protein L32e
LSENRPNEKPLRMRRKVKEKKPQFVRYESWRYARLRRSSWRRQKGLDNKVRLKLKGWEVSPNIGYRGPRVGRNLHPSGYKEIIVHNLEELEGVDPKQCAVRVAHTVGTRKRMLILGKTEELGLKVLNPVSEIAPSPAEIEAPVKGKEAKQEETPSKKKTGKTEKKVEKKTEKKSGKTEEKAKQGKKKTGEDESKKEKASKKQKSRT